MSYSHSKSPRLCCSCHKDALLSFLDQVWEVIAGPAAQLNVSY